MDPKLIPAWPLNFDNRPQVYKVNVTTNDILTSILTFADFKQAKDFQLKLNEHNLTRKASEPEAI